MRSDINPTRCAEIAKQLGIDLDEAIDFEAARNRTAEERVRRAMVKTYKPVIDDEEFRAFGTMSEYRAWCDAHVPDWLGYGTKPL